jgi:hypothetical protein
MQAHAKGALATRLKLLRPSVGISAAPKCHDPLQWHNTSRQAVLDVSPARQLCDTPCALAQALAGQERAVQQAEDVALEAQAAQAEAAGLRSRLSKAHQDLLAARLAVGDASPGAASTGGLRSPRGESRGGTLESLIALRFQDLTLEPCVPTDTTPALQQHMCYRHMCCAARSRPLFVLL